MNESSHQRAVTLHRSIQFERLSKKRQFRLVRAHRHRLSIELGAKAEHRGPLSSGV